MKLRSKKLNNTLDEFTVAMRARLAQKEHEGYKGWNKKIPTDKDIDNEIYIPTNNDLYRAIEKDLLRAENTNLLSFKEKYLIDIANRCMILWFRK